MVSNRTPLSRNIVNKQHTRLAEREPVILFDVPTQGGDLKGWPAFCGKYGRGGKIVDSFCLKAEAGDGLICSNSGLACSCVCVCCAAASRCHKDFENMNNKSGHLTAGHSTATTLTHTSNPGSSLPNLACLGTTILARCSKIAV